MTKLLIFRNLSIFYNSRALYSTKSLPALQIGLRKKLQHFDSDCEYLQKHNNKYFTFKKHDHNYFTFHVKDIVWVPDKVSAFKIVNTNTENPINAETIDRFEAVLNRCVTEKISLTSTEFNDFVDDFISKIPEFATNELLTALQLFARFPMEDFSLNSPNYTELFMAFDQMCAIKAADWDFDKILLVCDVWVNLPQAKKSKFISLATTFFDRRLRYLTVNQIVQAIHYMNVLDKRLADYRPFENKLEEILDTLTVEQLGIICRSFSKQDFTLQKVELSHKMIEYLLRQDIDAVDNVFLIKILHLLGDSLRAPSSKCWYQFLEKCIETIDQQSERFCCLLLRIGINERIYNEKLTQKIYQRLIDDPESLRKLKISDLSFLAQSIGTFTNDKSTANEIVLGNRILNEVCENWIQQMCHRSAHDHIVVIVDNLLMRGIYNIELIDNILRLDYIKLLNGKNKVLSREIYHINGFAQINLKDVYTGNLLDESYIKIMGRFMTEFAPNEGKVKKSLDFIISIQKVVEKLFKHFRYANAVSHYKAADIFVCYDKSKKEFIDVSDKFPPLYTGEIISKANIVGDDNTDLVMIALVAAQKKMFWNNFEIPTGFLRLRIEQLKLLGFRPVMISWHEWKKLNSDEREQFIKNRVDEIIKDS